jgi:hypothetical protein
MKYLKHINELYKKTYSSAADKLKEKHPSRSAQLDKWAEEKGNPEMIDKDFYHPFTFISNPTISDMKDDKMWRGKFYIKGSEDKPSGWAQGYRGFNVFMTSEYGMELNLQCAYSIYDQNYFAMKLSWDKYNRPNFTFDNRKDALEFRKYLVEDLSKDLGLEDYLVQVKDGKEIPADRLSINKLYSTK